MIADSRKATLIRVASFLILFSIQSWAAAPKKSTETYKDLIEKAQNLVLQKDRQQALSVLSSALQSEKPGTKAHKEIKKALNDVSHIFISDKAQQLYELSLSLKRADLPQAQQKINEALRIEPDNFTLVTEAARLNISKGECKAAEELITKSRLLNRQNEDMILAQAQAAVCSGEFAGLQKLKEANSFSQATPVSWIVLEIEKAIKEKNFQKAKELLAQALKQEKEYPENLYWSWRIDQEQRISNPQTAQKYLLECRNLSTQDFRRYNQDPWLCRRVSDVENSLKAQTANQ